jgi:hypothetical protein
MMWFHALQSKAEEASAFAVEFALLCDDGAFNLASRPEGMSNGPPGGFGVCSVIAGPVLPSHKAGRRPGKLEIDKAVLVGHGLDGVEGPILGELERDTIGEEGILLFVEAVVFERVRRPYGGLLVVRVEYFTVELAGNPYTSKSDEYLASGSNGGGACLLRYIAVYDLHESRMAGFGEEIEGLCLNTRRSYRGPLQIGLCHL